MLSQRSVWPETRNRKVPTGIGSFGSERALNKDRMYLGVDCRSKGAEIKDKGANMLGKQLIFHLQASPTKWGHQRGLSMIKSAASRWFELRLYGRMPFLQSGYFSRLRHTEDVPVLFLPLGNHTDSIRSETLSEGFICPWKQVIFRSGFLGSSESKSATFGGVNFWLSAIELIAEAW